MKKIKNKIKKLTEVTKIFKKSEDPSARACPLTSDSGANLCDVWLPKEGRKDRLSTFFHDFFIVIDNSVLAIAFVLFVMYYVTKHPHDTSDS